MPRTFRLAVVAGLCCAVSACAPASADRATQAADAGVEVLPAAPQLLPTERVPFSATAAGAPISVTWSIQEGAPGGTILSSGLYTAPASTGVFHVVATTASGVSGMATVTVTPTPVVQVTVAPRSPSVTVGGSITFLATVTGTANPDVSWTVQEGSAGGAISSTGVYTAPSTAGTYHVVATSAADGTKSDTATITVTAAPAVSVAVSPRTPSVSSGGTVTFTATVANAANTGVSWAVSETSGCGSITSAGVYTAPNGPATCHVVATSAADGTKSDTATITVNAVSVAVSPRTPSVSASGTITFTATVTNAANTGVSWAVSESSGCGTITSGGVYTAPAAPATCHVVATSAADGTKSDTATVTVSAPAGDLAAQLAVLATRSIYFGHQSVGQNTLVGIQTLLTANSGAEPTIVQTTNAAQMGPGIIANSYIPDNFDPALKLTSFSNVMNGGAGAKVNIAFMKFCWVDFDDNSKWILAGKTATQLFAQYQSTLSALKTAYPAVKFVHFTAPIFRDDVPANARRQEYNQLVRAAYDGKEPFFDLARLESTDPSGNPVTGSNGPRLYSGYAETDGGHLNATGQDKVARALVALLAGL